MKNLLDAAAVETAALLLSAPDAAARAAILASAIVDLIPDSACAIYRVVAGDDGDAVWTAIAAVGDISIQQANLQSGTQLFLPLLEESPSALVYPVADLRREDYAHLSVARSFASLAYVPLLRDETLVGAIEILTFSSAVDRAQLKEIAPLVQLASPAILAAETNEQERQTLLDSVHRMSQLYDLEKSLNSTLEFDAVIADDSGEGYGHDGVPGRSSLALRGRRAASGFKPGSGRDRGTRRDAKARRGLCR